MKTNLGTLFEDTFEEEKKRKNKMPLWADLLLIAVFFFIAAGGADILALALSDEAFRHTGEYHLLYMGLQAGAIFLAILLLHCLIDRRPFRELGMSASGTWGKYLQIGIGWTFALFVIGFGICWLSGSVSVASVQWNWKDLSLSLLVFFIGAFNEEVLIRGYLLTRLCRTRMNVWVSLIISSAVFSALHLANSGISPVALVELFLSGIIFGCMYLFTKNLWFPVIAHCAWNWIQGPVFGFKVSGTDMFSSLITQNMIHPNLINGGLFGFEGSLVCIVLEIVFIGLLIKVFK